MKEDTNTHKKKKSPWPTKEAMQQIYELHLWGGHEYDFYSGLGSHDDKVVKPYIESVSTFLSSFETLLTVCDLGCGDFNVGRQLYPYTSKYEAIDIVPDLIERNRKIFQEEHLDFHCLDIAEDEWPPADCIILRQVLQHLSNEEVKKVVERLKSYRYLVLTEHLPEGKFKANEDLISGQGIRLKKGSGLNLLSEPFNLEVKSEKVLSSINYPKGKGEIITTLFEL